MHLARFLNRSSDDLFPWWGLEHPPRVRDCNTGNTGNFFFFWRFVRLTQTNTVSSSESVSLVIKVIKVCCSSSYHCNQKMEMWIYFLLATVKRYRETHVARKYSHRVHVMAWKWMKFLIYNLNLILLLFNFRNEFDWINLTTIFIVVILIIYHNHFKTLKFQSSQPRKPFIE